ncbi:L-tyrosine/L-tryptophan isonitrile synthase family protein [Streptomyces sp. NPDC101225]|uniref:L-tyrosine/L-tryptophan isonitrile synthase family protein n=1 Tax=Streptomyces sp. NPDC101225 TaxID=3366135 RepID=UPI003821C1B9
MRRHPLPPQGRRRLRRHPVTPQRKCRQHAYGVIQRSRAWGDLVADHHPHSVRLDIPHPVGTPNLGIRLLGAPDVWTTPWHSAALRRGNGKWTLVP